jgi:hypothetical protein
MSTLESCLFLADEAEQTKNLVIAGFDIGRLGLSIGASASNTAAPASDSAPIEPVDTANLPF